MSSRAEVLAKVTPTSTYIGTKVKEFINEVTCDNDYTAPLIFKKGDVIRVRIQKDGSSKPRPSVIVKVHKDYVVSIPLTTTNDINVLCENTGSRFFKEGFFTNTYVVTSIEKAKEDFLGIYDSNKSLNNAIKNLKEFISKNI
jgi:hypothetical protein